MFPLSELQHRSHFDLVFHFPLFFDLITQFLLDLVSNSTLKNFKFLTHFQDFPPIFSHFSRQTWCNDCNQQYDIVEKCILLAFSDFHSGFTIDSFASNYEKNHYLKKTENTIVLRMIILYYIGLYFSAIKINNPR